MARAMSHIIGVILSLMMIISLSTGFYFWYYRVQGDQQGAVERAHTGLITSMAGTCLNVAGFKHNVLTNKSTVTLQNCGKQDFVIGDKKIQDNILVSPNNCAFALDNLNCDRCPFGIKAGELQTFTLLWKYLPECDISSSEEKDLLFAVDSLTTASIRFAPKPAGTCGPKIQREITLSNPSGWGLLNYQVNLTLNTSGLLANNTMLSNCADLEFKDKDASTDLPFFIENADTDFGCNKNITRIFVNVPSIPTSTNVTIFMVYNNSAATASKSNASNVFNFYDDFDSGATPDPLRWGSVPGVRVSNGYAYVNSTASSGHLFDVKTPFGFPLSGFAFEARVAGNFTTPNKGTFRYVIEGMRNASLQTWTTLEEQFGGLYEGTHDGKVRIRHRISNGAFKASIIIWDGPIESEKFYTTRVTLADYANGANTDRKHDYALFNDTFSGAALIGSGTRTDSSINDDTDFWNVTITGQNNVTIIIDWVRMYQLTNTPPLAVIGPESPYCES